MGKKLIVGFQSALLLYRAAGAGIIAPPEAYDIPVKPTDCTTRIEDFLESGNVQSLIDSGCIDIIARSHSALHKTERCNIHVLRGDVAAGSFCSVGNDVLVASPALTLLQLCQFLFRTARRGMPPFCKDLIDEFGELGRIVATAELVSELCGIYSMALKGYEGVQRHAAFTTIDTMRRYLGGMKRRRYVGFARAAVNAASPLSASPRETQLYLMMTTPWPIGYGIPKPQTNKLITIDQQSLDSNDDCKVVRFSDYAWDGAVLRSGRIRKPTTLEYDSDEFHTASAGLTDRQLADQAERRDEIEAQGNHYLRITTDHTRDFAKFDLKMRQLAKMLRIELPERSRDELIDAKRFFELLFDSSRFKDIGSFR